MRRLAAASVACGALTFTAGLCTLRHGAAIGPDGWAYWSGSVSLLEGRGYVDAHWLPIVSWPPLYPLWLALVQSVLGVQVGSVVVADALAIAMWAALFAAWLLLRTRATEGPRWPMLAFVVASPVLALRGFASEYLMLACLFAALLAIEVARTRQRGPAAVGWFIAAVVATVAAALTRFAALAFVPAMWSLVWQFHHWRPRQRLAALIVLSVVVCGATLLSRSLLRQHGGLQWLASECSIVHTVVAMARGVDRLLSPFPLGLVLFAGLALAFGPARRWAVRCGLAESALRHGDVVVFVAVALVVTAVMFQVVYVADPPGERFVRFAGLLLGGLGIAAVATLPRVTWRWTLIALLAVPTVLHAGKHLVRGRLPRPMASVGGTESFLPLHATLVSGIAPGTVLADGRLVVEMPVFPWLEARRGGSGR